MKSYFSLFSISKEGNLIAFDNSLFQIKKKKARNPLNNDL